MRWPENLGCAARTGALAAALCAIVISGCGTPGAPLPPSLNLPDQVTDLKAVRTGDRVTLTWTMPRRSTDKLLLKAGVAVRICRKEIAGPCVAAGDLSLAPGTEGAFAEALPPALAAGNPRPLTYFVELKNRKGRSAGLSNSAVVLAGQAPPPVTGLAAEVRKSGIVLRWKAGDPSSSIRLVRKLINPPASTPHQGPLAAPPEPVDETLLVDRDTGVALDKNIRFGETYEYRAQRLARFGPGDKPLELAGDVSGLVRIQALDVFPPATPTGLAAVATASNGGTPAAIDLSWQPNIEPDLAGYYVYRREQQTPWRRISGDRPVPGPAFHDAEVLPGHTYIYGVSAVDAKGNESGRSPDAEETVPQQ